MGFTQVAAIAATEVSIALPPSLKRPAAGNAAYRCVLTFRNGRGAMEAPDSGTAYFRLLKPDGTALASRLFADNAMASASPNSASGSFASGSGWKQQATALMDGQFEFFIQIQTADTEQDLTCEVGWIENGTVNQDAKRFRVGDAADLDTLDTNVSESLTRLGAGTDAAVAPGAAGTLQGHIREAQEQADTIQTEVNKIGAATDAAATAGAAGGVLAHIRDAQVGIDLLEADVGDASGIWTNLPSLVDYLGTLLNTMNVPLAKLLGWAMGAYKVTGTPTGTTFDLAALTGGPTVPGVDDALNGSRFVVLTGTNAGQSGVITDYAGATVRVTYPGGFTLAANDVIIIPDSATGYIGAASDAAAASSSAAGSSLSSRLRRLVDTLVGLPTDAGVDPDTNAGTLYAWLRHLTTHLHTIEAASGVQKGQFTQSLVNANANLTGNPTDGEVSATGTATDAGATPPYEVMHIISIALPETTEGAIKRVFATLKWTSQITTGTGAGNSKWMMSPTAQAETVGSAPSGGAVDITDAPAASTTKTTHTRSGLAKSSALPATNGFKLLLVGKCSTANDVLSGTTFESSEVEVTYERT